MTSTVLVRYAIATGIMIAVAGPASYVAYYRSRYGNAALSPAESWLVTRLTRRRLSKRLEALVRADAR